jgi:hypothetical protein
MKEQQSNKGQKGTWEGNKVVKHRGTMKHHTITMHEGGATKQQK